MEEVAGTLGEIGKIAKTVNVSADWNIVETVLRAAGTSIGMALEAHTVEHDPGWVAKKAHDVISGLLDPIHVEVNRMLGLPDDYRG